MADVMDISAPSYVDPDEKFKVTVTVKGTPDFGENRDDFRLVFELDGEVAQKVDDTIQDSRTKDYSFDVVLGSAGEHQVCARTEEIPLF